MPQDLFSLALPSAQSLRRPALARHSGGFTVLRLLLAMSALALAAHITISEVKKHQALAQRDQFVTDIREIQAVFEAYHAQKGFWPPPTNPDIRTPLGMETALAATRWLAGPPFGGTYEWQLPPRPVAPPAPKLSAEELADKPAVTVVAPPPPPAADPTGIIAITAFSPQPPLALTSKDLLYIDSKLDDGNLATGRFRTGFNGWPIYRVAPKP